MDAIEELAARYVAVWNEPDAAVRDAAVAGLWSADARAYTAANEYAGLDAITQRVTASRGNIAPMRRGTVPRRPGAADVIKPAFPTGTGKRCPMSATPSTRSPKRPQTRLNGARRTRTRLGAPRPWSSVQTPTVRTDRPNCVDRRS